MIWVLLFGLIAFAGLVMVVSYGIWLAHLAADVASEVAVLAAQAGELGEILGAVQAPTMIPPAKSDPGPRTSAFRSMTGETT